MFNAPTRFSLWAVFALTLLAGYGIEHWQRPLGRGLYWARLATAGSVAVSLGSALAGYLVPGVYSTFPGATVWVGVWGLGIGLLTLVAPVRGDRSKTDQASIINQLVSSRFIWCLLVTLLVAADLLWANWGLNPAIERSFYGQRPLNLSSDPPLKGRVYLPPEVEYKLKFERFMRFDTFNPDENWDNLRAVLLPNINLLDGIAMVNNFDPLLPDRYARWMEALEQIEKDDLDKLLILMGVNYVEYSDNTGPLGVRFEQRGTATELKWVPCARLVKDGEEAWEAVFSGQVDFDREVVIEQMEPERILPLDCARTNLDVSISEITRHPDAIRVRIRSDAPGYLFWSEVWYPGWRAYLDNREVPVLHANYLFRAVQVTPGEHEVFFAYRPRSFYAGASLSLLTIGLMLVVWIKSKV